MYISKEQLEARLKGQSEGRGIVSVKTGRDKETSSISQVPIPRETKVLIGALARVDSRKNVAELFGTSQMNVSNIARGISGSNKIIPGLKEDIDSASKTVKEDISAKALDVLMSSLGVVEEKVGSAKATDASTIAKNMAIVHDKMSPRQESKQGSNILIQINAPRQKSEKDYESMEVITV